MFRHIFGDISVTVPDEKPGKRWMRLRRITTLTRKQVAEKLEISSLLLSRLEADMPSKHHMVGITSVLKLATLYAEVLKCTPLQVLDYVYPELNKAPGTGRGR